jgi:predicted phage-related endonuclease
LKMNQSLEQRNPAHRFLSDEEYYRFSSDLRSLPDPELGWPQLAELGLQPEQLHFRQSGIGGSDANTILSGDADRIIRLWREKRGEVDSEDLSDRLPVMLGSWSEAFNRQWYTRETGHRVSRIGEPVLCSRTPWRRCTLDGFVAGKMAVFEAKHVSAFAKSEEILERYMPQLQHNMAVARATKAILSVIFGNHRWEVFEVALDWLYQEELMIAEARFWDCVRLGEPPIPAPVPAPPGAIGCREMNLEGNNTWASAAADWLDCRDAAKRHGAAAITIKELVEADVSRAFGHGIEVKRSKAGALSIREHSA